MESSKVQWLQRMGIDVWRSRNVDSTPQDTSTDESSQESTNPTKHFSSSKTNSVGSRPDPTSTNISTGSGTVNTKKTKKSTSNQQAKIEVCCSLRDGLLLIKDNDALDRDFTEDIFRAFGLLKALDMKKSEVSFFRFNWPAEAEFRYVKEANDTTLEGARRAFLAKARSIEKMLPSFVVGIGKGAVQLSDDGTFEGARVLHCHNDPYSPAFKKLLWNFLRDDR